MQLNSYELILTLLPLTLICYFSFGRINVNCRKLVICVSGAIVFAYAGAKGFLILLFSMAFNYILSEMMLEREWLRKSVLVLGVSLNVLVLFVFKYSGFAITNFNLLTGRNIQPFTMTLPLGISFFTFQQIAYLVNIYRGKIEKPVLLDYCAYILYFPKLIMGPITDPVNLIAQFNEPERSKWNWAHFVTGIKLFSFGMFKKMVLADTFAGAVSWGSANLNTATSLDWILIMLSYTFEIYFDFSGYSDMAIGVSSMMNIDLPMNFDSPYKALSVRDFWNRWHMSVTNFLTQYVYIPLGGSRRGTARTYLNVFLVFVISGIWHGANWTFLLWGAIHGILSVLDRMIEPVWKKIFRPLRWLIVFVISNVLWLLFSAGSIGEWLLALRMMVFGGSYSLTAGLADCFRGVEMNTFEYVLGLRFNPFFTSGTGWMLLFLCGSLLLCLIPKNNYRQRENNTFLSMVLAAVAFAWSFLFLGTESVFIYNTF